MADPSPIFTINGSAITNSVAVQEGATITCTLVDISGVAPVTWSVALTDDTSVTTDFSFAQSGSVGQTYTGTALGPGKAAIIRCTVNGGILPSTEAASTTMTAEGKFYTPTRGGREVLCAGELDDDNVVSDSTHGATKPINEGIRDDSVYLAPFDGQAAGGGTVLILNYTVPTDCRIKVTAEVLARDTVTSDSASYVVVGAWKNIAGVVSQIGAGTAVSTLEDDAAWGVATGAAATEATMTFTGDGVNATNVEATFRIQRMNA
jgi:hypothetical protein